VNATLQLKWLYQQQTTIRDHQYCSLLRVGILKMSVIMSLQELVTDE